MIFSAILQGLDLYNRLRSFFFFRWFSSILKQFVIIRTRYKIELALSDIRSLNNILYEYALFLHNMRYEYEQFSPRKSYQGVRRFIITYSEGKYITDSHKEINYISRVKCIIIAPDGLTITVKCSYNFFNSTESDRPNVMGCYVSFKDNESEYTIAENGLNEFFNELFDYIEENIIHDSMLVFTNYIIDEKA